MFYFQLLRISDRANTAVTRAKKTIAKLSNGCR
jgi:hypothetical protein